MSQLIARHTTTKLYELTNTNIYLTSVLDTSVYRVIQEQVPVLAEL